MVNKTTVDLMNDIHADDLEDNTNKVEDLDISCAYQIKIVLL